MQIQINQRKMISLETELKEAVSKHGASHGPGGADAIVEEILQMKQEARMLAEEMDLIEIDAKKKETVFGENKNYVKELQEQVTEVRTKNEQLKNEEFNLRLQTQQVTAKENELEQIESDCNFIERQIRDTTAAPFARKEGATSLAVRVNELEEKLREK